MGSRHVPRRARRMRGRITAYGAALSVALVAATLAGTSGAAGDPGDRAPRPFRLLFEGGTEPNVGQENPRRAGTFDASPPVCTTGIGRDVRDAFPLGVLREHTCRDGSGTFTVLLDPFLAEHGGAGRWRILGGTGRYAALRGQGTFTGELVSGSPTHAETITFRTTWTGLVGFDNRAPVVRGVRLRLTRSGVRGAYRLRVTFRARDDVPGNAFTYRVLPTSGSYVLPFAEGRSRSPSVRAVLVVRPRRPDLPLLVEIRVADPLGNERRVLRSVAVQG